MGVTIETEEMWKEDERNGKRIPVVKGSSVCRRGGGIGMKSRRGPTGVNRLRRYTFRGGGYGSRTKI
jgi:hypothetical protein